jgi:hypothetical protein
MVHIEEAPEKAIAVMCVVILLRILRILPLLEEI